MVLCYKFYLFFQKNPASAFSLSALPPLFRQNLVYGDIKVSFIKNHRQYHTMKRIEIGGKVKNISLNSHFVSVITPRKDISYEDGLERINKIIEKVKA